MKRLVTILIVSAALFPFTQTSGLALTFSGPHPVSTSLDGARSVFAGDIDKDLDMDLVTAWYIADSIIWWENADGVGGTWTSHSVDSSFDGATSVFVVDLDGDVDLDILGAAENLDTIAWWENLDGSGGSWIRHTVKENFFFARCVTAFDMDKDSDMDVIAGGWGEATTWWENTDGTGTSWTEHAVDSGFTGVQSLSVGDLDGDLDPDVLAASYVDDSILWWENTNGAATVWTVHVIDSAFDGAQCVFACNVDGDLDLDILCAGELADAVTWWENLDGSGSFWASHTVSSSFDGAVSVLGLAMDGDADLDVLGAGYWADDITWWENLDGSGTSWTEHTIDGSFDGATRVHVTDVDGDVDVDVVAAGWWADEIAWWERAEEATATPTATPTSSPATTLTATATPTPTATPVVLTITDIDMPGKEKPLLFTSTEVTVSGTSNGQVYTLQYASTWPPGVWQSVPSATNVVAAGDPWTFVDSTVAGTQRYYRLLDGASSTPSVNCAGIQSFQSCAPGAYAIFGLSLVPQSTSIADVIGWQGTGGSSTVGPKPGDEIATWKNNDYVVSWLVDNGAIDVDDEALDGEWHEKTSPNPSSDTLSWGEGFFWHTQTHVETLWIHGLVPEQDFQISVPARPVQILVGQPYPVSAGVAMNRTGVDNLGFADSGGQSGNDPSEADHIRFSPCGEEYDIKFLSQDGAWHDVGAGVPTGDVLLPGQGFWVERGSSGAGSGFLWTYPMPY